MKSQRDNKENNKFVAFAFATADSFLEVNSKGDILFESGVPFAKRLVSREAESLKGLNLKTIVHPGDFSMLQVSLEQLEMGNRVGPIAVRFGGLNSQWQNMKLYAIKLPDHSDSIYISLSMKGHSLVLPTPPEARDQKTGLLEKDTFTTVAAQAMKNSNSAVVSMAHFEGLEEHAETVTPEAHDNLIKNISTHLQAMSLEGQTASQVGGSEFAILHDKKNSPKKILEMVTKVPGVDQFKPTMTQVGGEDVNLSEKEIIKAVAYTLDKFSEKKGDISISSLEGAYDQAYIETQDLLKKLKYAIERKTMLMAFQPIVQFNNLNLHHYEVLGRLPKNFGNKTIFEIVTFAEEVGMITQFDMAMCLQSADFLQRKRKMGEHYSIAVNISGASVQNLDFIQELISKFRGFGGLEKSLAIEVTESSKILDLDAASKGINALRKEGFKVCLDDFGAGASGYQYLRELKVDFVKIDGIYIRDLLKSEKAKSFVTSMVNLCGDLNIKTIAEFVESQEEADFLKNAGVTCGQGYLFGKPEMTPSYKS